MRQYLSQQMRQKVAALTRELYDGGSGDRRQTAQVLTNFMNQRAVTPFVKPLVDTPRDRFAENSLSTLKQVRAVTTKPGGPADMFRRAVIAAGGFGPLSDNEVCKCSMLLV